MSFWSKLLTVGGKALGAAKTGAKASAKSMGNSVIHPSQTLNHAGKAVKTATVGGAVGKVSGLRLAGLVAAAYLIFGRFGWLGKIAGTMLGMMLVGNNANLNQMVGSGGAGERRSAAVATAEDTQVRGMRR